mmetsp:Transcript_75782/g.201311  ORF Transcript_75782/g.201311 Transcript_75782/m.201311 type:complete len:290 (-) Transcript_75782:16-885(-)
MRRRQVLPRLEGHGADLVDGGLGHRVDVVCRKAALSESLQHGGEVPRRGRRLLHLGVVLGRVDVALHLTPLVALELCSLPLPTVLHRVHEVKLVAGNLEGHAMDLVKLVPLLGVDEGWLHHGDALGAEGKPPASGDRQLALEDLDALLPAQGLGVELGADGEDPDVLVEPCEVLLQGADLGLQLLHLLLQQDLLRGDRLLRLLCEPLHHVGNGQVRPCNEGLRHQLLDEWVDLLVAVLLMLLRHGGSASKRWPSSPAGEVPQAHAAEDSLPRGSERGLRCVRSMAPLAL